MTGGPQLNELNQDSLTRYAEVSETIETSVGHRIVGQPELIRQTLVGLLAEGHVLLEGVPGLGKTELVKAFSAAIGVQFARVQFTPDLMPADIVGTTIYNRHTSEFTVKQGPVFSSIILVGGNLIVDVLYGVIDPRIRLQ